MRISDWSSDVCSSDLAIANGCVEGSVGFRGCVRSYIFDNYAGTPGVVQTGVGQDGQPTGTIAGQPGDPLAVFRVNVPVNKESSQIDGWELNIQHMFGDTGFGVSANYTIVDSDRSEEHTSELQSLKRISYA